MNIITKIKFKIQTAFLKTKLKKSGRFMICNPLRVIGAEYIEIGNRVFIREQIWLEAIKQKTKQPKLVLKDGVYIGDFAHINAMKSIVLEENVVLANHVFITDHNHSYEDIDVPILKQDIKLINEVVIGRNSWIGEKVSIIGATIGKNSIVGANSVVTKDIPDYSIAVGSPAKIIKKYNFHSKLWEKFEV